MQLGIIKQIFDNVQTKEVWKCVSYNMKFSLFSSCLVLILLGRNPLMASLLHHRDWLESVEVGRGSVLCWGLDTHWMLECFSCLPHTSAARNGTTILTLVVGPGCGVGGIAVTVAVVFRTDVCPCPRLPCVCAWGTVVGALPPSGKLRY